MGREKRPVYESFADPVARERHCVFSVCAAALSGFDKAVALGRHYFTMPEGPFVLGREGVARDDRGGLIYFNVLAPVAPFGSMAERTLIDPRFSFPAPDVVAPAMAAALGNAGLAAWLALSWRARIKPGDRVLILGATGMSGLIAVTAAKRLGAGKVIAAGRNADRLQLAKRFGADETVDITATDLVGRYREAAQGTVDIVIDYLCGAPAEAALDVVSTYGRVVHVGTSAGPSMKVMGANTRRTCVDILGFAYYHAPIEAQAAAFGELCRLAAAGEVSVDFEVRPLAEAVAAWDAHASGTSRRQVLVP